MPHAQQKSLFLQSKQGEFVIGFSKIPDPGPEEILIKVMSTALNPIDWKIHKWVVMAESFPAILGCDAAGIVEAVGERVTKFMKGDRV